MENKPFARRKFFASVLYNLAANKLCKRRYLHNEFSKMEPKTIKTIFSVILFIGIVGGAALLSNKMADQKTSTVSNKSVKKERRQVRLQSFSSGKESNEIRVDGRIQAHDRVAVTSKVQGILQDNGKALRAGNYIKEGEPLFIIDAKEAGYNVKAQRSGLLTSITQMMPDLKFDYPESYGAWENYLRNMDVNRAIAPLPTPSSDREKFFVAGKNIFNQYYSIKSAETRLADFTIYSPFSGIITEVNAFPGALVSPGQSLAMMINTATYEMLAPVELGNLKYVSVGQKVTLHSTEMGKSWEGRVSRIGSLIDQATQNIPLYVSVRGKGLKDGMYLQGAIGGASLDEVMKLPKSAFTAPDAVFVVEDSTIVTKVLEPVKRLDEYILVRGLSSEDAVVVSSLSGLFEGQKVNY